jgi:thioredoxin-like negative regulator of GroEL
MRRALYLIAVGYLAICGLVVVRSYEARSRRASSEPIQAGATFSGPGEAWWSRIRANCNPVEVELAQRMRPAPAALDGQAYSAACWALAGRVDSARAVIDRLPAPDRYQAAGVVFNVAHPIAEAGDDRSAGPIMELVVQYWPNHYMALYHAGMAEYATGQRALARKNLAAFLTYYHEDDGWTQRARETLRQLGVGGAP